VTQLNANGFTAKIADDGRVRINGNLEELAQMAIADSRCAFNNINIDGKKYLSPDCSEVVYHWWIVFDGLTRRYTQENKYSEANFTNYLMTRVFEPAYNFRGIPPKSAAKNIYMMVFLLVFYIGYTILYGFSIMYIFEGLGISVSKGSKKQEA
jgi:hypothetical protein